MEEEVRHPSKLWSAACVYGGRDVLRQRHGLLEDMLENTVSDSEDSAPCVILNTSRNVEFATRAFEKLVGRGYGCDIEIGLETFTELLRPRDVQLDELINGRRWDKLTRSIQKDNEPEVVELLLCKNAVGDLFWTVAHAFRILDIPGFGSRLVIALIVLEAPVPEAFVNWDRVKSHADVVREMIVDVHNAIRTRQEHEAIAVVSQRAEHGCKSLVSSLSASFEGEHFVPLVACETAKAFEQLSAWEAICGNIEKELRTAWETNDEAYRDTIEQGSKALACAVADPTRIDCPLVYISQGFEELTQYRRTWAVGRNCRFLQPNKQRVNADYNDADIKRMRHFCTKEDSGQIVNFLLNEKADGTFFWNLLFMNHIRCKGLGAKREQAYIFGAQTNIVAQKGLLDTFILEAWEHGDGKKNLQLLRDMFAEEELNYNPKATSLKRLGDEVISKWALEIGKSNTSFWEGASYVPVVGSPAVMEFIGQWPHLVEQASHGIRSLFEMSDAVLGNMKANSSDEVVCSVSDPSSIDCPLVYISKGFENMTGYDCDWTLGRNCRFLQPNTPEVNKKLNGDELQRMRVFCRNPMPKGEKILNLLLNERRNGKRFWNLLHMEHVEVNGKPYILGVQTVLDLPMPSVLKDEDTSAAVYQYDCTALSGFLDELCKFLRQIRVQLRGGEGGSMLQTAKYAQESITAFMKRNCDDFEGDHLVPRIGGAEADHFRLDVTWRSLLQKLESVLAQIWGVSQYKEEEVACAVSDPSGKDCPLVYVSHKFEMMTGYSRHWVLGRNCRFLQPNDHRRNMLFNEDDKSRMRAFCSGKLPQGSRIINLLVNESRSGQPFWNLLVMEHVWIENECFIFGVQTTLDTELQRLAEVLCMDDDGLKELSRLRVLLRTKEQSLQVSGLRAIADMIIREWASGFPLHLELPRLEFRNCSMALPFAGLMINPDNALEPIIQKGLEEGVRHFAFALNSLDRIEDGSYVGTMGHLLSLKIGELLYNMRRKYLNYLQMAIAFTIITRPQYISCFAGIYKALASCGYKFACWFLDVRGINPDHPMSKKSIEKLQHCWQMMCSARDDGDVRAIGLFGTMGSIMVAMEYLRTHDGSAAVSVLALDLYPNKEQDMSRINNFQKLYVGEYGKPPLLTYSLFGPKNQVLNCQAMQELSDDTDIDAHTLLLKWAEAQGYGVLATSVRDDIEIHKDEGHDEAFPKYSRAFTREYANAPSANDCSDDLEAALASVRPTALHSRTNTLSSLTGALKAPNSRSNTLTSLPDVSQRRHSSSYGGVARRASTSSALPDISTLLSPKLLVGRRRKSVNDVRHTIHSTSGISFHSSKKGRNEQPARDTFGAKKEGEGGDDGAQNEASANVSSTRPSVSDVQEAVARSRSSSVISDMLQPKPPSAPRQSFANPVQARRLRTPMKDLKRRESGETSDMFPEKIFANDLGTEITVDDLVFGA